MARGQPVTLNCRAAGHPAASIVWLQDGRPVTGERPDRLVLAPGSLFFLAAKERDAGVYQCRARSAAGEATSRNATLLVASESAGMAGCVCVCVCLSRLLSFYLVLPLLDY